MSEGNISLNRISLSCVAAMGNKINNSVWLQIDVSRGDA
jgi:hypothetical protein